MMPLLAATAADDADFAEFSRRRREPPAATHTARAPILVTETIASRYFASLDADRRAGCCFRFAPYAIRAAAAAAASCQMLDALMARDYCHITPFATPPPSSLMPIAAATFIFRFSPMAAAIFDTLLYVDIFSLLRHIFRYVATRRC